MPLGGSDGPSLEHAGPQLLLRPVSPFRAGSRGGLRAAVLAAVTALPFLVAVVVLHGKQWFPTGDLAQAEMRVRDVWSHLPLVGAAGRISTGSIQGSHPGPLMFWAAWPVYALLGRSAWALEAAYAVLNVGWIVAIAFAARRRGGTGVVLAVLAVTSLLVQSYGLSALTQPWNPYAPLLAFLLFLLLVWGILCDDLALVPAAVAVGSYCIQCHVSYAGVVGLLLVVPLAQQLVLWTRERSASGRRPLGRWIAAAVAVGLLAWVAPLVQQVTRKHGNFWITYQYLAHPDEQPIGWLRGVGVTLLQLNPWGSWLSGRWQTSGSVIPGLTLLLAWVLAAAATWSDDRRMRALRAVIAVAFGVAVVSASRIFGEVWGYLVEWMWSITALMVLDLFWATLLIVRRYVNGIDRRLVLALPSVVLMVGVSLGVVDASHVPVPSERISEQERVLATQTLARIDPDRTYLVDWKDPIGLGGTGFGLMLALERHGIANGALPAYRTGVRDHRVVKPNGYDAVLQVVTGYYALLWRHDPRGTEIACVDVRTAAERTESQRLERELLSALKARGVPDPLAQVRGNLFGVVLDPSMPPALARKAQRILDLMEVVTVVEVPGTDARISPEAIDAVAALPADEQLGTAVTCPEVR